MNQVLTCMAVALLWGAAGTASGTAPLEPRLQEAQAACHEAMGLYEAGRYAAAISRAEHSRELWEELLGDSHPEAARCLDLLGYLHLLQGDSARAEPLLQRGLAILEATLGRSHPDVATSLDHLASSYKTRGAYNQAEPLYQRALAILETTLGDKHPDVARTLDHLAQLYVAQGSYGRAKPLHERALAILEATLGRDHPDVAASLNSLANLYTAQGLYAQAEPLYQRALAIREAVLGKHHPDVATSCNFLARLYARQGSYGRAEPLYQRALTIREAVLGKTHPDVAASLNNLANLYVDQGLYERAEPLYQRALAIREAALGAPHPDIATSLNNLANLYLNQGLYGRAEPLYRRALAMDEAVLGGSHPDVARTLNNLAHLYTKQGSYARAGPLLERALAIGEALLGATHPDIAYSLDNLASLYMAQGSEAQAEPLLRRALAVWEAALGANHPRVASTLNTLALLRLTRHRLDEALPLLTRAFALSEGRLRREGLDFSEARLTGFLQFLRTDEERLYTLAREYPEDEGVRHLTLTAALLLKGRSVEETASTSRTIYRSLGAQDRETFERLRGLRTQLAALSFQGPGPLASADYLQRMKELASQGDALEADLARRSAPLRVLTALPSPADIVEKVAKELPQDGALVEFIAYTARPLLLRAGRPMAQGAGQLRYLALVLFPDAHTRALDLGPAAPIDSAASGLRDALARRDANFQASTQTLYQLVFRPLLPLLGGTRHLFLAPDGQLGLVPFSVLHDGRQFLVDSFEFTYLTSGKDLLPRSKDIALSSSVVVLADPDFSAPRQAPAAMASPAWAPLPGARQEAEAIQRLIPRAQLFLGPEATKERLLHLPTPGVLHLATHGFFLENVATSEPSRAVGLFGALSDEAPSQRSRNPLLRSGLVMAGARVPISTATDGSRLQRDDALVTALELAGLDLWGTELVVLSACDTGRGDIKLGQGVYGLRRALVIAGAETIVMSLWKVNDNTTGTLMESYYRHLLEGQSRGTALREAMRTLRRTRPHPHYWAPFIALGRDAPLRALAPQLPEALRQASVVLPNQWNPAPFRLGTY